ncbi:unnamed protein product [Heligmosomoides polygyrus]|uniref:MADF domain-containing protein n=1 Tax=Heligmosomoides polygyrus TaxID=6339 RepID=A0A183FAA0_HELPZ|nr:unnamed protein product [Heligmosomoides polygyrus]
MMVKIGGYKVTNIPRSRRTFGPRAHSSDVVRMLTLTAIVHLYALSVDKDVNEAYWSFKRDYEKNLRNTQEWDTRVRELMEAEGIRWKGTAAAKLRKLDEEKLISQDA